MLLCRERGGAEVALAALFAASSHCFVSFKANCSKGSRSTELRGSSELVIVKLQSGVRRRKVSERAEKYVQGSLCYASVPLQIVLCTKQVTEDVEGWQGKFGVR